MSEMDLEQAPLTGLKFLLAEDDAEIEFETSETVKVTKSFKSMGLNDALLKGIYAFGEFVVT